MSLWLRKISYLFLSVLLMASSALAATDYRIRLASGDIHPVLGRTATAFASTLNHQHLLIQFDTLPSESAQARLRSDGIELLEYIPNNAFTAKVSRGLSVKKIKEFRIRWAGRITADQKLSPLIQDRLIPIAATHPGGRISFAIVLHVDESTDEWANRFQSDFGAELIGKVPESHIIEIIATEAAVRQIAEIDAVLWVEPGMTAPEEHNSGIRAITGVNTVQAAPFNLSGLGVRLAQWDGGRADLNHTDFGGRVFSADGSSLSDHATHVAGTVLGSGLQSGGNQRGMAPGAEMSTQIWWLNSSTLASQYSTAINLNSATISTNSWGFGVGAVTQSNCANTLGNYFSVNTTLDDVVRGSQGAPISICWSAGNHRSTGDPSQCGTIGWIYGTISPPGTAKNVITVGATNSSNNSMTSFSSWGPTDDGRLKPDVVAAGCAITSTALGGGYSVKCGTSMSTPAVAGIVALLTEEWTNKAPGGSFPLPSTFKGVLINSAIDMGPVGPDYQFGHGAVDAVAAVQKIGDGEPSFIEGTIAGGESQAYDITVPSGASKLKVTLVWDDIGGSAIGGGTLINDLDLKLVDPFASETLPWLLNPSSPSLAATTGADHVNNVETAEVSAPVAGLWKAVINGFAVPMGTQKFSLIFTPDSSHTPGSLNAVAVFESDDVSQVPGQSVPVSFYVSNVGADLDSISVQITDSLGWLQETVDSVVILQPFDSAFFQVDVLVPPLTLAGDVNYVKCSALSLDDSVTSSIRTVTVTSAILQDVSLVTSLVEDSVSSPDIFQFSLTVSNKGNALDNMTVVPDDMLGWNFSPAQRIIVLQPNKDSVIFFDALVPAEVQHLAVNQISTTATVSLQSDISDTAIFTLITRNAIFPPSLVSPILPTYSNSRLFDFNWNGTGDSFTLEIARDTQFTDIMRHYSGLTGNSFSMPVEDSLLDDIYYWGVRRFVGGDSSSLQRDPGIIGVDNLNPGQLILLDPLGDDYLTNNLVRFVIANDTDSPVTVAPEWYKIEVASDENFTTNLSSFDSVTSLTMTLPSPQADGRWFWRARHIDAAGNLSNNTQAASYLLDTEIPAVPILVSPVNMATLIDSTVRFKWNGTQPDGHEISPEYFFFHVSTKPDFSEFNLFNAQIFTDSVILATDIFTFGTTYHWRVKGFDSAGFTSEYSLGNEFTYASFVCGDIDNDGGNVDIADLTFLINFLFINFDPVPPVPEASNIDCQPGIDIADLTMLIDHLFINFPPLCCNQ